MPPSRKNSTLRNKVVALDVEAVLRQSADAEAKPASLFGREIPETVCDTRAAADAVAVLVAAREESHAAARPFRLAIGELAVDGVPFQREAGRRRAVRGLVLQAGIGVEHAVGGRRVVGHAETAPSNGGQTTRAAAT